MFNFACVREDRMDIPEILATLGTQDTGRNQAKHHQQQQQQQNKTKQTNYQTKQKTKQNKNRSRSREG